MSRKPVFPSEDFYRIKKLAKRKHEPIEVQQGLTALLKTPQGEQTLRPLQAMALCEAGEKRGGFFPLRVGLGKTLISLLLASVIECKRPTLILPAALIDKTEKERQELSKHWRIFKGIRLYSYEMLGRVQGARSLDIWRPDLVIADECHRLKNKRAGVTRRVVRYMLEHPETAFVAMSGTVMKNSLRDFAHVIGWCLKDGSPLPLQEHTVMEWADALDEKVNGFSRLDPGVLLEFCEVEDQDPQDELGSARRGFRRRLTETPAVVASSGVEDADCSLYISALEYDVSPATEKNFTTLRTLWETPDGWALSEAMAVWRHARELAIGLHYCWDPRPPPEWLLARKLWAAFVRETLSNSRTLDTELQVANAVLSEELDSPEYHAWREIKDTFTINSKPVWHDTSALEVCERWAQKNEGIVWCEHTFFAEELSRRTGLPYFGSGGLNAMGQRIEECRGSLIASVAANSTGRNLQRWSRNLITAVPNGAPQWEQLMGRTHRSGQQSDEVTVDVLFGCAEHHEGFERARAAARMIQDSTGHTQKILTADVAWPKLMGRAGTRWVK